MKFDRWKLGFSQAQRVDIYPNLWLVAVMGYKIPLWCICQLQQTCMVLELIRFKFHQLNGVKKRPRWMTANDRNSNQQEKVWPDIQEAAANMSNVVNLDRPKQGYVSNRQQPFRDGKNGWFYLIIVYWLQMTQGPQWEIVLAWWVPKSVQFMVLLSWRGGKPPHLWWRRPIPLLL